MNKSTRKDVASQKCRISRNNFRSCEDRKGWKVSCFPDDLASYGNCTSPVIHSFHAKETSTEGYRGIERRGASTWRFSATCPYAIVRGVFHGIRIRGSPRARPDTFYADRRVFERILMHVVLDCSSSSSRTDSFRSRRYDEKLLGKNEKVFSRK